MAKSQTPMHRGLRHRPEERKATPRALFKSMLHHLATGKIRVLSTMASDK